MLRNKKPLTVRQHRTAAKENNAFIFYTKGAKKSMNDCEMDEFLRFAEANSDPRPMYDPAEIREAAGRMSPYDELRARCES